MGKFVRKNSQAKNFIYFLFIGVITQIGDLSVEFI